MKSKNNKITLSIVIPTWNEEKYLPKLLKCIKAQTFADYEIIVSDDCSNDKTKEIAKKYGCRLVMGKKSKNGPGPVRNNGAKAAKGEILLFLDADVQFDFDFLENSLKEIKNRKLDVAGVRIKPENGEIIDKFFLEFFNFVTSITQFFYPNAYGGGIFCKKWLHKKINGFDKTIKLGEDLDYVQRCGKLGKFGILNGPKIIFSMRRFENEGRLKVASRHFLSAVYRVFFGQIRTDIFKYNMRYQR